MDEKKHDEYHFLKEHIKKEPVDKKRFGTQILRAALAGIVFGVLAALVFCAVRPAFEKLFTRDMQQVSLSEEQEEITEKPSQEPEKVIITETQQMELEDYQVLQNKLYGVGKEANKSVVSVIGVKSTTDWFDSSYETQGQGAGIIIAETSLKYMIVTEKKLIADAQQIDVAFYNDTMVEAELVAYDGNTGIAVLSVDKKLVDEDTAKQIKVAELGNSTTVMQGTVVIAIGSPLGETYSILTGNVTATDNEITTVDSNYDILTTDIFGTAKSSGALINLDGKVIGLVMQDYSTEENQNTITALGISDLRDLMEKLSNGKTPAYLGLEISTVSKAISNEYHLPTGVYIKDVRMDSPAMEAGLHTGDVIVRINRQDIVSESQYESFMNEASSGQGVLIDVKRMGADGEYQDVSCTATLGEYK